MKIIFRIEHPQHQLHGPFSQANPSRDALSAHTLAHDLPEAYGDVIGFNCGRHICATATLEHVVLWFGPFLAQLTQAGFVVTAYEVLPDKLFRSRSGHQVAFDRADAQVVGVLKPAELLRLQAAHV
jgi:hypothetical protein